MSDLHLALLILWDESKLHKGIVPCYERVDLNDDPDIFRQLMLPEEGGRILTYPIPDGMRIETCEDRDIVITEKDALGRRLRYVFAKDFRTLKIPKGVIQKDRAIKMLVSGCPDMAPFILWWA